jgi:hypothetical protein
MDDIFIGPLPSIVTGTVTAGDLAGMVPEAVEIGREIVVGAGGGSVVHRRTSPGVVVIRRWRFLNSKTLTSIARMPSMFVE